MLVAASEQLHSLYSAMKSIISRLPPRRPDSRIKIVYSSPVVTGASHTIIFRNESKDTVSLRNVVPFRPGEAKFISPVSATIPFQGLIFSFPAGCLKCGVA